MCTHVTQITTIVDFSRNKVFRKMSKSDIEKVVAQATDAGPTVVDYDSDEQSDEYEDASEEHDGLHDPLEPLLE